MRIQLTVQFTNLICDSNRKLIRKLFIPPDCISEGQKSSICWDFFLLTTSDQRWILTFQPFISSKQIRTVHLILNSWSFVACFDFSNNLPYIPHSSLVINTVPSMIIFPKNAWMPKPFFKFPARTVYFSINNRPRW